MNHDHQTDTADTMTLDELRRRLGISATVAYQLANLDQMPVPVIRVGRRFLFSRKAFDALMRGSSSSSHADRDQVA